MNFGGDHSAPGHGKIVPRCVPRLPTMARLCPDAFSCCRPWQDIAPMRSRRGLGRENASSRQHISCMYSNTANFGKICVPCIRKAPQSAVGECTARTSCRQGAFSPSEALKSCTARESRHSLMDLALRRGSCPSNRIAGSPFNGLAPAQGFLPEQPHRGIAFQRPGPCAGMASHTGRGSRTLLNGLALAQGCLPPSASPIPATCRYPPLAVPVAARDKPPMSFGGDHPAHGLRFGQAPRGRRLHHLDGRADNGMLRRTGPELQNREQVGAEPQAEVAGPPGPASALPKRPSEGRVPLDGTIGTPPHASSCNQQLSGITPLRPTQ